MKRSERRRRARAMLEQITRRPTVPARVQTRRVWAVTVASWLARVPLPARMKTAVCSKLVHLAQYRVDGGAWQTMPFEVTP